MSGFINAEGLFNGERLRRCSNLAQLHFPRLFLLSDGFGRIELNYAKILRAYATFNPLPSEIELQSWIQEYVSNFLLFVWMVDGQLWGQWDAKPEYLPRYKTAADRRSPIPPENELGSWKARYRTQCKAFPKSFENLRKVAEDFAQSSVVLSRVEERREEKQQQSLAPISKVEWPETTAMVQSRWESVDGMFILRLVQDSVQAAISSGIDPGLLTDEKLAEIVRESLENDFNGPRKNAGVLFRTVPQIVKTRAERYLRAQDLG